MRLCVVTASSIIFFFNDTATTDIYTLPLHAALPIYVERVGRGDRRAVGGLPARHEIFPVQVAPPDQRRHFLMSRSEEHTSELQSQSNLVCRLLLEKKKHYVKFNLSSK